MGGSPNAIILTPDPVVVTLLVPAVTLGFGTKTLTPSPVVITLVPPAVTIATLALLPDVRVSNFRTLVRWITTLPGPFYVWRDSKLVAVTHRTSVYLATAGDSEDVVYEVFTNADERPTFVRSNRLTIEWGETSDTREYRVERNIASVWTPQALFKASGQPTYKYRTLALDDDALHEFRVIPVGVNSEEGTALTVSAQTVRNPDPPVVEITFNNTVATLTIEEV